jgi:hypothetical protein
MRSRALFVLVSRPHERNQTIRRIVPALAVLVFLLSPLLCAHAFADSSDRSDLYGITLHGDILHFDKTSGAATLVKMLPSSFPQLTLITGGPGPALYGTLAVVKGTFVTTLGHSSGYQAYFYASGLTSGDELWLGNIRPFDTIRIIGEILTTSEVPGTQSIGTY